MFRIPDFYDVTPMMEFKYAAEKMTSFGRGDLLEGMNAMDRVWEEHCASGNDDDDFFENYGYECSAYNIVFEGMSKLFEGAK